MSNLFISKSGSSEIMYPLIIFVILNLLFFSAILIFVHNSSRGTIVYQEFYAKQIALLINGAEPDTFITIDFEDGIRVAENNGILNRDLLVTSLNKEVIVKLSSGGGYGFKYFSDYNVNFYFEGNNLTISIE